MKTFLYNIEALIANFISGLDVTNYRPGNDGVAINVACLSTMVLAFVIIVLNACENHEQLYSVEKIEL